MNTPRVSVILPTYNRANLIQRAIDSVLTQTFDDFELIVVDDASEDETPDIVQSIEDDRLTFIRHEENKYGRAWNTGIEHASGEYISFIDDDDEWYPFKLEKQVARFEETNSDVGLIYCWREVYEYGELVNEAKPELSGDIFEETIVKNPIGNTSTFMIKSNVFDDIGKFDESLPCGLDSDLLRRIAINYDVDYVPELLVKQHWKHQYDQISDDDTESLYESIAAHKATLEKFKSYLNANPTKRVELHGLIGRLYMQTGDYEKALFYFLRILASQPFSRTTKIELHRAYNQLRPALTIRR